MKTLIKIYKLFLLNWLDICPNCKAAMFAWSLKKHICTNCGKTDEQLMEEI